MSRARTDHQYWLQTLQAETSSSGEEKADSSKLESEKSAGRDDMNTSTHQQQQQQRPASTATGGLRNPWPQPDFYQILVVAQDGVLVGSGLDNDGSVPVHTLEFGTTVAAYERCVEHEKSTSFVYPFDFNYCLL